MLRSSLVLMVCLGTAAVDRTAQAGWYEFWHRVHVDIHRNNAWPQPFVSVDEKNYVLPFETMTAKGWLRQNTIGQHHFDAATNRLTEAGQLKLRWILTHTPPNRRVVVVVRGDNDEITSMRTDSVQQAVARLVSSGPLPEVRLTDIEARGWSAEEIDAIGVKAKEAMKPPVLPPRKSSTAGGS